MSSILRITPSSEPVLPDGYATGSVADVGAVQVQPDAARERLHMVFGEASVGAGRAGLRAGVALLDAADERSLVCPRTCGCVLIIS